MRLPRGIIAGLGGIIFLSPIFFIFLKNISQIILSWATGIVMICGVILIFYDIMRSIEGERKL